MPALKPPLLVIGATRSGKSTLARLLSDLPGVVYWSEPSALLRTGHAYRRGPAADARDAKPWVKRRIERVCLRYQEAHGGRRIVIDAGPQAVLKIPFLHAVFPQSRFIHVCRDGRTSCALRLRTYAANKAYDLRNLGTWKRVVNQVQQVKWWELPAYASPVIRAMLHRYILRRADSWQGIMYEGWETDQRLTPQQLELKRWAVAVDSAIGHLERLPADAWTTIRLEDLTADPEHWIRHVLASANLNADEAFIERAARAVRSRSQQNTPLPLNDVEPVRAAIEPTLQRLGYL
jgi:hypothetical protein